MTALEEFVEEARGSSKARIVGSGSKSEFVDPDSGCAVISTRTLTGVTDVYAGDQMVTVWAGTPVDELQAALRSKGQCLPLLEAGEYGSLLAGMLGTVGGLLATNLPHGLTAQHGSPRDWLLQAETLFGGEIAKSGAKVVKNVAGYDVHKFLCGTWGRFGPFLRVTLRTWPLGAIRPTAAKIVQESSPGPVWILRTLPTLFNAVLDATEGLLAQDRASCTLWTSMRPANPREGWIIGPMGEVWSDTMTPMLSARAKAVFDPEDKWR